VNTCITGDPHGTKLP